jgi:hypothetical protein
MGSERGMLLLHSTGSRSGAVAFHKAVKEARLKLQQQAAALKAAGQLQQLQHLQQQQQQQQQVQQEQGSPGGRAYAPASVVGAVSGSSSAAGPVGSVQTAAHTASASKAAAAAEGSMAAGQPGLTEDAAGSSSAEAATAADSKLLARKSATVGQLARASLTQQSLLFDGKRPPPAPTPAAAAATAGRASGGGSSSTATAAGAAGAGCARPLSPDTALGVMCDALERGMSVPNPEVGLLLSDGHQPAYGAYRCAYTYAARVSYSAFLVLQLNMCCASGECGNLQPSKQHTLTGVTICVWVWC